MNPVAIEKSCGCTFCDLNLPPDRVTLDGKRYHELPAGKVVGLIECRAILSDLHAERAKPQ